MVTSFLRDDYAAMLYPLSLVWNVLITVLSQPVTSIPLADSPPHFLLTIAIAIDRMRPCEPYRSVCLSKNSKGTDSVPRLDRSLQPLR